MTISPLTEKQTRSAIIKLKYFIHVNINCHMTLLQGVEKIIENGLPLPFILQASRIYIYGLALLANWMTSDFDL